MCDVYILRIGKRLSANRVSFKCLIMFALDCPWLEPVCHFRRGNKSARTWSK